MLHVVTCETMVASTKNVLDLGVDLDCNYIAWNILKKSNSRLKFLWRHAKFKTQIQRNFCHQL